MPAASPHVGHYPFPFKHIPDISAEASRQIRRNFEALLNIKSGSPFDATIDPALGVSVPGDHAYVNLTELIAHESWAVHSMFSVGVRQRFNVAIVEPATPLDITAVGDLSLFGVATESGSDTDHLGWEWATLTCNATQQVYYENIVFQLHSGRDFS